VNQSFASQISAALFQKYVRVDFVFQGVACEPSQEQSCSANLFSALVMLLLLVPFFLQV